MCKEGDDVQSNNQNQEQPKEYKGLPEPGKIGIIPKDSLIPPVHDTKISKVPPKISNQATFADIDLSSISEA
ncbi:hypothetical protein TVAG_217360 [Trichomonas vaginalis G3]|uniref:Uncharacterized protein n=1 Tax=Trichomonas vaginalis (strain ATCC PRA-98 / G3) TaxID=412133 RepID=A2EZB8_TRIV3|nr:hypothetical protein TVAGG3_0136510 [Trichomonas vaginalis G3]EAY01999.1 hypothetical protein TVAG_217360 [Trichomonas vaginalis G3]KAI5546442.1 hypothetical protein TVAGG3_0136510 [Trichomonas vaginalis G3]|eukprot:XP_001330479.1 hypothetical protein [Trichomonas vaginalis G3]